MSARQIWQPLYPGLRQLLDPEYVAFHDRHLRFIQPVEAKVWDRSARGVPSITVQGSPSVSVGNMKDIELPHCQLRVFEPVLQTIEASYAALLWFHGGGWVSGDLESENDFCAYLCQTAQCVVISVAYRLAPECPYPAAAEDAVEALTWLIKEATKPTRFNIDITRIAIGGHGAGGNLAAVLVMEAACLYRSFKPRFQLLILPIIDNCASPGRGWINIHAPWLTPARALWQRSMYLPRGIDPESVREDWQTSPNLAPTKLLAKNPQTWIAVAEHDLLATEAMSFAHQLRQANVQADVKIYEGSTHLLLDLNGVLMKGRQMMWDAAYVLGKAFRPQQYNPWPSPSSIESV
ncbi:hypothetical protein DOTSEDRAFT_65158 [Dothistroma septosporum NZE10]|uniref:Alpha/beta hydrolase fold-3 domain-containing protein n=1 Tax=Dothistroma septosporum (strain NZE10 / CBS 128990) TaxID=675120 RepID=N1PCW9_DOTSN|nr:hypothetical protein DOTSEDRAFT_65158 [Dothistroma septosporum NZE10]